MSEHLSEFAVHLLADKLAAIRAHAEPYALGTRTDSSSVRLLAKYHVRASNALIGYLGQLDLATEDDLASDVARVFQAVRQLSRMSRFFSAGDGPPFLSDVLVPWTNTVKAIAPDVDVIIRAQSAYEFESRLEIRVMLDKMLPREISRESVFRGFPQYFLVLNVPVVEGWNLLHQTLIAHEIGHFIFVSRQLEEKVSYDVVRGHYADIERAYREQQTRRGKEQTLQEFLEWCSLVITSRFKELISDVFAAQIVGPCVLPALRDFGLPGYSLDFAAEDGQMFDRYPSFRKRFSKLLEKLAPFWSGSFRYVKKPEDQLIERAVRADIRKWRYWLRKSKPTVPSRFEFLDLIVDECVDRALDLVSHEQMIWEYQPEQFRDDIFELYNRIQDEIPPNEILAGSSIEGRPAAWQSVLNAAWLHYCYNSKKRLDVFRFQQPGISEAATTRRHRELYELNDFMTRSLEMAIIHKQFLDQKKRLGGMLDDAVGEGDL